jgi:hypothetical protein
LIAPVGPLEIPCSKNRFAPFGDGLAGCSKAAGDLGVAQSVGGMKHDPGSSDGVKSCYAWLKL